MFRHRLFFVSSIILLGGLFSLGQDAAPVNGFRNVFPGPSVAEKGNYQGFTMTAGGRVIMKSEDYCIFVEYNPQKTAIELSVMVNKQSVDLKSGLESRYANEIDRLTSGLRLSPEQVEKLKVASKIEISRITRDVSLAEMEINKSLANGGLGFDQIQKRLAPFSKFLTVSIMKPETLFAKVAMNNFTADQKEDIPGYNLDKLSQ